MKTKRASERMKNAVIVLLLISAVLHGWASRLFGNGPARPVAALVALYDRLTASSGGSAAAERFTEAAKPWTVLITNENGGRYAVRYDTRERDTLYGRTSGLFGEAIGSAGAPVKIAKERWRTALEDAGIYYEYALPIKLFVLSGWFGARVEGDWGSLPVRRIAVVSRGDAGAVLFQDAVTGDLYEAKTAMISGLESVISLYDDNGAAFAFQRGLRAQDETSLILEGAYQHPLVEASSPLENEDNLVSVLNTLGVSEHLKFSYIDRDGARVYVEQSATISVSPGGLVRYRVDERTVPIDTQPDEATAIEMARDMAAKTVGLYSGEAEVTFSGARAVSYGVWEVEFVYAIAGGRIDSSLGYPAARITVTGAEMTEMELYFRTYHTGGGSVELLPEAQAVAAAGGMCRLVYVDNGGAMLEPAWMVWSEGAA
ncbi:MAG TPA: hypothetical protein GXZ77_00770 [Papillibacter sp.]|nr:hypothetical protein [Papillibacter sp.]